MVMNALQEAQVIQTINEIKENEQINVNEEVPEAWKIQTHDEQTVEILKAALSNNNTEDAGIDPHYNPEQVCENEKGDETNKNKLNEN